MIQSPFFKEQEPIFREQSLEHLLFGTLHYEEQPEGKMVIEYGDEAADKFYHMLGGEVSVWIPKPYYFKGIEANGHDLTLFLLRNYDHICWRNMPSGAKTQDYLLQTLVRLKVNVFALTRFDKLEALEKVI